MGGRKDEMKRTENKKDGWKEGRIDRYTLFVHQGFHSFSEIEAGSEEGKKTETIKTATKSLGENMLQEVFTQRHSFISVKGF